MTGAFADLPVPVLLVGMDTPHVTAADLDDAVDQLLCDGTDAVLGAGRGRRVLGHGPAPARARSTWWVSRCRASRHRRPAAGQAAARRGCGDRRSRSSGTSTGQPDAVAVARAAPATAFAGMPFGDSSVGAA